MKDMFGIPLNVGDKVIYTTGAMYDTALRVDIIKVLHNHSNGLIQLNNSLEQNLVYAKEVVAVNPIQAQHPELFI